MIQAVDSVMVDLQSKRDPLAAISPRRVQDHLCPPPFLSEISEIDLSRPKRQIKGAYKAIEFINIIERDRKSS